ncbi:TonB-dependent receptor, partial [Striga asiatica]
LGWRVALGFHKGGRVGRRCVVDGFCKGYGHYAECLRLKKLHCGPNVFFHEFSHLSFRAIVGPLFPGRLSSITVSSFFLLEGYWDVGYEWSHSTSSSQSTHAQYL